MKYFICWFLTSFPWKYRFKGFLTLLRNHVGYIAIGTKIVSDFKLHNFIRWKKKHLRRNLVFNYWNPTLQLYFSHFRRQSGRMIKEITRSDATWVLIRVLLHEMILTTMHCYFKPVTTNRTIKEMVFRWSRYFTLGWAFNNAMKINRWIW